MSAQAKRRSRTRRAMSADGALTRAQERMNSKIDRAINAGTVGRVQRNMNVTLQLASGGSVRLVSADGVPTREGIYYYAKLGIEPPSVFAYEQGLENGRWVKAFGREPKKLVRRMTADGWQITKIGQQYFKYNRDTYEVRFPTRLAIPTANSKRWTLDAETFEYKIGNMEEFTVGKLKQGVTNRIGLSLLASDAEREQHVRDAAIAWIRKQSKIRARDLLTGEDGDYHVVLFDSPRNYVWDESREIRITRKRENVYDRSNPTTDEILERPLRQFFVVPDGCYRPWDLHPMSLVKNGRCAVTMLHSCFLRRSRKRVEENGRTKFKSCYAHVMTEEDIERDLDVIFQELGYVECEYPFENSWKTDGCTSKMILAFCRKHHIICHVMHGSIREKVESYTPEVVDSHTSRVDFFIRDDHCFWYGKEAQLMGFDNKSEARNGISNIWKKEEALTEEEKKKEVTNKEEDIDEYFNNWQCLQTAPCFAVTDKVPPFSEWKHFYELLQTAPTFQAFKKCKKKKETKIYFFHTDLESCARQLREHQKSGNFSMELKYGKSPDVAEVLVVDAPECPTMIVRKVPPKWNIYQAIFAKGQELLKLSKGKQLVYKGEFPSSVCERLRLEVSKPTRHRWTDKERESVRLRQGCRCVCGTPIEPGEYHLDHIQPLYDGGEDSLTKNIQALCLACHGEKSETERLGAIYQNSLYSALSRDTLEAIYDAPAPQQLVFGDGTEDCFVVDAIRCRPNCLLKGNDPLPVASIVDRVKQWDDKNRDYKADFYYIDAGDPLDDPLEALPYLGPNFYARQNAFAILEAGYAKGAGDGVRKISTDDFVSSFTASHHEPADALVKPYEDIEHIVSEALKGLKIRPSLDEEPRDYTEDEIRKEAKLLILAMQGGWTSRHTYRWKVENSYTEEHATGPVHMWRPNHDGTTRWMSRTELLSNRTMYLIGRMPLDGEHHLIWRLYTNLKQELPRPIKVHGCINDCLFLTGATQDELEEFCEDFLWTKDSSPICKLEAQVNDAPLVNWHYRYTIPQVSIWRRRFSVPEDDCDNREYSYGHWNINGGFLYDRFWRIEEEEEGIGTCDENDTYQERMADLIVDNCGGYVSGRGGTGKSYLLRLLKEKFEKLGYRVHYIAFTHVAAANLDGNTILHELHQWSQGKRLVIIVDECSMVPLSMWAALANLTFTGNIIIPAGDMDGQFLPIQDQHRMHLLTNFDKNDFMHDVCNGLHITLNKFRRRDGDKPSDYNHFQFVSQLYPKHNVPLETARTWARIQYEAKGSIFLGTTLCITHRARISINAEVNVALAPTNAVFVPAFFGENPQDANQPQDMKVWEGIVLMARCKSREKNLKNGVRYKVVAITAEEDEDSCFELRQVDDQGDFKGESFILTKEDIGSKMRLTHAITYFASQARTICGGLRLTQTGSKLFTLRHLIVGLGRAPIGADVQVE